MISEAWEMLSKVTIRNCFEHCGFLNPKNVKDLDNFDEIDHLKTKIGLINMIPTQDKVDCEEFLDLDDIEKSEAFDLADQDIIEMVSSNEQRENEADSDEESTEKTDPHIQAKKGLIACEEIIKCFNINDEFTVCDSRSIFHIKNILNRIIKRTTKQEKIDGYLCKSKI